MAALAGSGKASARTTPVLLALFTIVSLLADSLYQQQRLQHLGLLNSKVKLILCVSIGN